MGLGFAAGLGLAAGLGFAVGSGLAAGWGCATGSGFVADWGYAAGLDSSGVFKMHLAKLGTPANFL